ncbi:F0F1 ATP synthase subunit epsilon [Devosia sp. CN2-171]|jgi:F-type H+-transporting ATPase subunit epsilon|uniref:F0F1 ATP synthase subunit epsilon n=1 Tax=Devosia sp. CN2-171 TaxID=3400909 RepID=UPI003BF85DEE
MAEGTKLEIVSPEKLLLSETVKSVTVPGTDGYFTVLGDHAPFMTTMKPGFVTVVNNAGISHVYYVRGGFADVSPEGLTILAEEAQDIAEFDKAKIEGLIAAGLTAQQAASTADDEMRLQEEIDGWRNLLLDASVGTGTAH